MIAVLVGLSSTLTALETGTIEGVIRYQADPARPWRYARYYVQSGGQGELAETVVALRAVNLKKPPVAEKPEVFVIDQRNFQFLPETAAIRAGQSVKFLNSDKDVHNVNAFHPRHSFNVIMPAGGEHVEKFEHAGGIQRPYRIGCVYHSAMRSWVFVFDHPWFCVTAADGRFRLTGVPAGEQQLDLAHPAGELRSNRTVQVLSGETARVEWTITPDDKSVKTSAGK